MGLRHSCRSLLDVLHKILIYLVFMNDISSQFVNDKHFIIHNDGFVVHKKSQILYQLFTIAVWKMAHNFLPSYFKMSLVSTYVVCERLSVMHQPARLPENFDQISPKHPCSGISFQNSPPPEN